MTGAGGIEAGNPALIKKTAGKVKGNSSTHGKSFDEDEIDRRKHW
jgi:hypothetical protein